MIQRIISVSVLVALMASANAAVIAPKTANVSIEISQMGVPMKGQFAKVQPNISFDAAQLDKSKIQLKLDTQSLQGFGPEALQAGKGEEWLNTAKFPSAEFVANRISKQGAGFIAEGNLTVKGITKPVKIAFEQQNNVLKGRFQFNRTQYALGTGSWGDTSVVKDPVTIQFEVK